MAFKSNLDEVPRMVEHSNVHWLSSENEVRFTYNMAQITDEFVRKTGLVSGFAIRVRSRVGRRMDGLFIAIVERISDHRRSLDLARTAPDGTLMVANQESQFGVNIRSLEDRVTLFRKL